MIIIVDEASDQWTDCVLELAGVLPDSSKTSLSSPIESIDCVGSNQVKMR